MSFVYEPLVLPKLEREHIGDKRLYFRPDNKAKKFISITTITSFFNRHIFINWRKKVGNVEADKITKASTTRGTDLHTLNECYIQGLDAPEVPEITTRLSVKSLTVAEDNVVSPPEISAPPFAISAVEAPPTVTLLNVDIPEKFSLLHLLSPTPMS